MNVNDIQKAGRKYADGGNMTIEIKVGEFTVPVKSYRFETCGLTGEVSIVLTPEPIDEDVLKLVVEKLKSYNGSC